MAVTGSDLQFYYPSTINDGDTNGGRLSHLPITSGAVENVFPNVPKAERLAGSTKYRKVFAKVHSDNSDTVYYPKLYLFAPTPAGDMVHFVPSTQRGTKADLTGLEDKYGAATLVSQSTTTLVVDVEDSSLTGIFRASDEIIITNKATPTSTTGNEETRTIVSIDSVVGARITMTISSALANVYAAGSKVASIYPGTTPLACTVSNWVETSSAGTYDEGGYPVIMNNRGTIEQTWTVTFLTASTFTVTGDTVGSVGSGGISADFVPNNANFSKPYFTLEAAGFGGTWAQNDTIVFQTHPITVPVFEIRNVPANTVSFSSNLATLVFTCEA